MGRNKSPVYRNYIRQVVYAIKNRPCSDCSQQFTAAQMTFDHVPGFTKRFTIGSAMGRETVNSILREIVKCEIVCRMCHDKRENRRRENPNLRRRNNKAL